MIGATELDCDKNRKRADRVVQGFFGGKFLPMHKGHLYCIDRAAQECDRVLVVLFINCEEELRIRKNDHSRELEPSERILQMRRVCGCYPNVDYEVIDDSDLKKPDGSDDWEAEAAIVRKSLPRIDYVYSSEPDYGAVFAKLYPEAGHVIVDAEREKYPISGTMIRAMKYLEEKEKWMV